MNFSSLCPIAASPPAGGAELGQVIIATLAAVVVTAGLLYIGFGHRSGRIAWLGRTADRFESFFRVPGWSALPSTIGTTALVVALFGMYWDISLHIDDGRDPGPLANPAHYFILAGLFGIFSAGFIAMVLPRERPSRVSIRLGRDWWAPLGGVLICACGMFSLIGFPLDDIWHRIFGQDVTLWGPTHLMLIGGAAMALIGNSVLAVEGFRANAALEHPPSEHPLTRFARTVALTGGLLIGLSTFQGEFDFGVPQFQLLFQPMLIMLAGAAALVIARTYGGRGSALGAVVFFIAMRGALAVAIGPLLGETMPHFPLYIAEALVVEVVGLRVSSDRPLRFALWSGLGIGTVGLAAEWAWSHAWMPLSWPAALFPEGVIFGFMAAMCGAAIGAWIGTHLTIEPGVRRPGLRTAAVGSAALLAAMVAFALHTPSESGVSAHVVLHDLPGTGGRQVEATIDLRPRDAADGAEWLNVTAWQGGGRLVVDDLEKLGAGRYRTTEPIPVYGDWKTMVRLQKSSSLTALPIYLPRDTAIPVGEVPAPASFTRPFGNEHQILQREQKGGSPLLVAIAYSTVAAIALALLALLAWALHRLAFGNSPPARNGSSAPPAPNLPRGGHP